jgi:rod shape determining protein RodA
LLQPDAGSALVFFSFFILLFREGLSPIYYIIGLSAIGIFVFSLMASPSVVTFGLLGIGTIFLSLNFKNKALWSIIIGTAVVSSLIFVPSDEYLYMLIAGSAGLGLVLLLQWDRRKVTNYIVLGGVIGIATLFSFGSNFAFEKFLEPHQQDRINVWLRPQLCDPQGSLYNIIQSKLAIGSGGLQGKGFMNGDMTKLNYVPEQSSDFIFSIIGEEQGFLGVFSVIVLFLLLLYRIIIIGERAKNNFIRHYAYGIAGIVFVHYFINIGMTMGIMPVIGIPLPFLSQGGTALIAFSLMIGVLLKMDMSR